MKNKIVIVVKSALHSFPPIISQAKILQDLNQDVSIWYGSCDANLVESLSKRGINMVKLDVAPVGRNSLQKLINWYSFRNAFRKKIREIQDGDIFWIGNAETALPLIGIIKHKYVLNILELLDDHKLKRWVLGKIAQKAEANITVENSRSYLLKYWFKLKTRPFVVPNKPYFSKAQKRMRATSEASSKNISLIKDKKVIIYQGIYQNITYLEKIAKALNQLDSQYYLVLMGFDLFNTHAIDRLSSLYDKVIELRSLPAPTHLEVTSYARIGIVYYPDDSLNRAFCAPNKIYEYSAFGIPSIGNRIPGLENTIGMFKAGILSDFTVEDIKIAIQRIDTEYSWYSKNARRMFDSVDNREKIREVLKSINH